MAELAEEIRAFEPLREEEARAREQLLELIARYGEHLLDRDCEAGHITCSGFILSPDLEQTLMAYHLIYRSVGWTGGHADGEKDLAGVAIREAKEETSVTQIYLLTRRILSIDILPVPPHEKHGKPVPAHLHYNVTYGLIAPVNQRIADKPDENHSVRWLPVGEIAACCTEPHMIPIYTKLVGRMQDIAAEKSAVAGKLISKLLPWYGGNHRDLPWRRDKEPYHIWLSEIMLQQTRVEAVKGYYAKFLAELPDIPALATCAEEKLLKLWEGLGYYNRARNLQKAAKQIMDEYGGTFPQTYAEIRRLSGIGDYTAGAIASICYDLPTPAVDGNVLRVMARLTEDFRNILDSAFKADVTAQIAAVYPQKNAGDLTQALIEIGAVVCIPNGAPRCGECPLKPFCMAHRNGSTELLPVREKKTKRRTEQRTVLVLSCEGKYAVRKRPPKGLLASLYELPNVEGHLTAEEAVSLCSQWGTSPKELQKTVERRHIFTHITWEMQGIFIECAEMPPQFLWVTPEELSQKYSLPTAFRCVLE
ncbi:MAG: A/G-specific adenine glycosylase [Oscillospiraceae bacterium]|nr:A/G-specific adenine glycosylase [Oscillospiraceae bacterium]